MAAEIEILTAENVLAFGSADIEAVFIDIGLDHRVHQGGDVQVTVHVFSNAGGTDRLKKRGQCQGNELSAKNLV